MLLDGMLYKLLKKGRVLKVHGRRIALDRDFFGEDLRREGGRNMNGLTR